MYEKGPFNIHLKVKRPDTAIVEGKKEKGGQYDIFNAMDKSKISFQSIRPAVANLIHLEGQI
jgi:hypothetical protein